MPSVLPGDPYAELLARTRGLGREQRHARDAWFQALEVEGKEDLLFELEVLLKSSACFANPRNHAGPPRRTPVVAQDFVDAARVFRDGMQQALSLVRTLIGSGDRAYLFQRYLETVMPEDRIRSRLAGQGLRQNTPDDSLVALRHALARWVELLDGILRAPRVPFRLFYAVLTTIQREIGSNAYFNPLSALEFRPEFDRIHSPNVLELIRRVPGDEARRLVALTFLSLFRLLRYLRLIQRVANDVGPRRRQVLGRGHLALSVFRSDARALADYLTRNAGSLLGRSFERDLLLIPASEIRLRTDELRADGYRLIGVKSALEAISGSLRLEIRRSFNHDLPHVDSSEADSLRRALSTSVSNLRPALRNAVLFLGKALGTSLDEAGVFDDQAARRETSERLRRDIWMFEHIVRAFVAKAQSTPSEDRWAFAHNLEYVRVFLGYFRTMGYPLLRSADYPRFDAFMRAMDRLTDTDVVDPARVRAALDECIAFQDFLRQLFEDVSRRDVLRDVEFDRRAAAAALKLYISE